jgi:predicted secreted protein
MIQPGEMMTRFRAFCVPMVYIGKRRALTELVPSRPARKKKVEKREYMHLNPVKRGLVSPPGDWAWRSYPCCEGRDDGLLKVDPM